MPLLLLLPIGALIYLFFSPQKTSNMQVQVTTKLNQGQTGYVLSGNKIAAVQVSDVSVADKDGTVTITNTLAAPAPDGTASYPDTAIYASVDELCADLKAQYEATLTPVASPPAPAAQA